MTPHQRIVYVEDEELQLSSDEVRVLLEARAARLATAYFDPQPEGETVQLATFSRAGRRYGIEVDCLVEIRHLGAYAPVPGVPPVFVGVIHLRGDIVAVVDLAVLFDGSSADRSAEPFAVVVEAGGVVSAFLADSVDDVADVAAAEIHPPLSTFSGVRARAIRGIARGTVAILDCDALLGDETLRVGAEPQQE